MNIIIDNKFTILIVLLICICFFVQTYFEIERLTNNEELEEHVDNNTKRIEEIDINVKINSLKDAITNMKQQLTNYDNKFDSYDKKFDGYDKQIELVESQMKDSELKTQ